MDPVDRGPEEVVGGLVRERAQERAEGLERVDMDRVLEEVVREREEELERVDMDRAPAVVA